MAAGDGLCLITRDLALASSADGNVDLNGAYGTAPSEDHLSVPARGSGFVDSVLESEHTVGGPIRAVVTPTGFTTAADHNSVVWAIDAAAGVGRGVVGVGDFPRSDRRS
jgi:hypothetical protein